MYLLQTHAKVMLKLDDEPDKAQVADATNMMELRIRMLKAFVGTENQPHSEAGQAWTYFQQKKDVTDMLALHNEPHPNLLHLQVSTLLRDDIGTMTCSSWDDLKTLKESFVNRFKVVAELVTHVGKQVSAVSVLLGRMATARKKDEDKALRNQEREVATAAQAAVKRQASDRVQAVSAQAGAGSLHKNRVLMCLAHIPDSVPTILERTTGVDVHGAEMCPDDKVDTPVLFKKKLHVDGCDEHMETMFGKFKNSQFFNGSKRASDKLVGEKAAFVPECPMKLNCEKVKQQLRGDDVLHFECGWWWGMAPTVDACGLEMCGLPSCKYVYKGQRTCLLVKFDEAAVFCKSSMGTGAQITLDKVKNFIAGADAGLMVAIATHVTLLKVIQPADTT